MVCKLGVEHIPKGLEEHKISQKYAKLIKRAVSEILKDGGENADNAKSVYDERHLN